MALPDNLEQRLAALEQEVTQLKAGLRRECALQQVEEEPRGARLIREAEASRPDIVAGWRKFLEDLGIQGQPIGAKKLRALLLEQGLNPHDNEFSRGIIAMREE